MRNTLSVQVRQDHSDFMDKVVVKQHRHFCALLWKQNTTRIYVDVLSKVYLRTMDFQIRWSTRQRSYPFKRKQWLWMKCVYSTASKANASTVAKKRLSTIYCFIIQQRRSNVSFTTTIIIFTDFIHERSPFLPFDKGYTYQVLELYLGIYLNLNHTD